jgi:hypothetical protein
VDDDDCYGAGNSASMSGVNFDDERLPAPAPPLGELGRPRAVFGASVTEFRVQVVCGDSGTCSRMRAHRRRRRVRVTSWAIIITGVLDLDSPLAALTGGWWFGVVQVEMAGVVRHPHHSRRRAAGGRYRDVMYAAPRQLPSRKKQEGSPPSRRTKSVLIDVLLDRAAHQASAGDPEGQSP